MPIKDQSFATLYVLYNGPLLLAVEVWWSGVVVSTLALITRLIYVGPG